MARFSAGARMTNAPTSTLPGMSIYCASTGSLRLRELWVFNTTTTAFMFALRRLSTAGTQGAAVDEQEYELDGPPVTATVVNSHTVGPTITAGFIVQASVGAAIGAAAVFSFGDNGLLVPSGTGNGLGITTPTGTGQVGDVTWVWDE
jgi:hypothetical protein